MSKMTGLDYKIKEMAGRIRELREIEGFSSGEMAEKTGYHLTFPQPLRHEETEERDHPAAEEEEE